MHGTTTIRPGGGTPWIQHAVWRSQAGRQCSGTAQTHDLSKAHGPVNAGCRLLPRAKVAFLCVCVLLVFLTNVADLADANNVVRRIKATTPRLKFKTGMDRRQCTHVAVHAASFANMPNHKSQRGVVVLLADRCLLADHQGRYVVHPIMWANGRITRVEKSTLSAEAYSCTGPWTRSSGLGLNNNLPMYSRRKWRASTPANSLSRTCELWDPTIERPLLVDGRFRRRPHVLAEAASMLLGQLD